MATMQRVVSKGVVPNGNANNIMTWWKTNFNMPVPDLFAGGTWPENGFPFGFEDDGESFDLSGFFPGLEALVLFTLWFWYGPASGTTYLNMNWKNPSGQVIGETLGVPCQLNIASGEWYEYCLGRNVGLAPWEIANSGNYKVGSWTTGYNATALQENTIAISNVPSVSQLASEKPGYIWVEGYHLAFVNANQWKHVIQGYAEAYVDPAKAGYIWIGTDNCLRWIGSNGWCYRTPWKIKQVASTWSGGPSGQIYAGTQNSGKIWVDNEFGWTHLSYIGYDGYKYLVGAGKYPYQSPS